MGKYPPVPLNRGRVSARSACREIPLQDLFYRNLIHAAESALRHRHFSSTQIRKSGWGSFWETPGAGPYRLPVAMSSMRRSGSAAPHSS